MRSLLLLALLSGASAAVAQELPRESRVPGGVAIVSLGSASADSPPAAYFNGQRTAVVSHSGQWKAVVGLSLSLEPGRHVLKVESAQGVRELPVTVTPKKYPVQRLTLKDKRQVDPSAEDLVRIGRDKQEIERAFASWSESRVPELRFGLPANGRLSSGFGLRRYFNGQSRAPHSGLDIAAPVGTPIVAPASGIAIVTGEYFFNGKTVFLDHGQGLISMYNHLNHVSVTPGAKVERGDVIGEIGLTGRTTGPHLHWTVSLNNARVDPALFIDTRQPVSGKRAGSQTALRPAP
jgi:murein DD-endopeptidase MepM/ murein hydrolase activator NlpD